MSSIQVRPVRTSTERKTFLTFPWRIYHRDPLWVPPLLPERAKVIDPKRGTFFKRGQAELFIAWKDGRPVGTMCAADDRVINQQRDKRECMFGFFECFDEYAIAEALFLQVEAWAREHDLDTLFGPFNLDYEDSYGILIEGRDRPPAILCGHTPPYYQSFVERFGFQPARGDNLAFGINLDATDPTILRLRKLADRLRQEKHIVIRNADVTHFEEEAERVYFLINRALAHLPDFIPWQPESVRELLQSFLPIADPELILFAEIDGQPVGWFPGIPDLNEAFIHANGLRYPWDYARLWWYMRRKSSSLAIKSVLVLPEYWDTGVAVLLFDEMVQRVLAKGYRWVDMSLTSDDNPDTPILAKHVGAKVYKRYRVYRRPLTPITNNS